MAIFSTQVLPQMCQVLSPVSENWNLAHLEGARLKRQQYMSIWRIFMYVMIKPAEKDSFLLKEDADISNIFTVSFSACNTTIASKGRKRSQEKTRSSNPNLDCCINNCTLKSKSDCWTRILITREGNGKERRGEKFSKLAIPNKMSKNS